MKSKLVYNERTWGIDLITEINQWVNNRNIIIKRATGEYTLNTGKNIYFPDVLLHGDREGSGLILQGWELKMPDVNIKDSNLLENAKEKALKLSLNSFLVWNVTHAALYKVNKDRSISIIKNWNNITNIRERTEVERNSNEWRKALDKILRDLIDFFKKGYISSTKSFDVFTGAGLTDFILTYTDITAKELEKSALENIEFYDKTNIWWETAKNEYIDFKKPWIPLAKIILISILNKFIIGHMFKYKIASTDILEAITSNISNEQLFKRLNSIRFNNTLDDVFKPVLGEVYIPKLVVDSLIELNTILDNTTITKLDDRYIQMALSKIIDRNTRKIYGQFTTPVELSVILNCLTINNKFGIVLDPCCGTGTLIKTAYNYKKFLGLNDCNISKTLKAYDKLEFPLKLTKINLYSVSDNCNFDIKQLDIKDIQDVQGIDCIISNPPYVKQKDIKKLNPELINDVNKLIKEYLPKEKLQGKSDLYAYIPFKMWSSLKDNGSLGLIISNSWLSSDWGIKFYEILNKFYQVKYIMGTSKGRWFKNSDIVSTLIVLRKRSDVEVNNVIKTGILKESTKFILLKNSLKEIVKNDVDKIDFNLVTSMCTNIRTNREDIRFNINEYTNFEIEELLSYGIGKNALFIDMRFIFNISSKLIPMKDIFNIGRGERRGWDEMFYPNEEHKIEKRYLKKVLKNSREIEYYVAETKNDAFCCEDSLNYLKENNFTGALNWIKKFENEVNNTGKPLKEVLARTGIEWYTMKANTVADICISINPGDRLFYARFKNRAFVNQRLITLINKNEDIDLILLSALLNSTLGLLFVEALGFGRGLGVLDLNETNLKNRGVMLNPNLLNNNQKNSIINSFKKLEKRKIYNIIDELKQSDRIDLDKNILEAYGIDMYQQVIYKALEAIYNIRISVNK